MKSPEIETETITCDVAVLGAGPGGYSAAFRAADLGLDTVLIDRNPTLGGVCLNVGCIPSKALLHSIAVMEAATQLSHHGITFAAPEIDLAAMRAHKSAVIGKLTTGLAAMAKMRKVHVVQGDGVFETPHRLRVADGSGGTHTIEFTSAIIAAGSEPVRLPNLPDDPRIVDSTGALELPIQPKRMLVIGGGIIGLEMATVYSGLGARVDIVELTGHLMSGTDRDLVAVWSKANAHRFDSIFLNSKVTNAEAAEDGIHVRFDGASAPSEAVVYDLVLESVGRTPNGSRIGADAAGVTTSERGFIETDRQMRTNVGHIFAIGDIAGGPLLAHKAVHEGHVAAEAAAGQSSAFDARQIPSVAYTDPEVAWAGETEISLKAKGRPFEKSVFPWAASGRAIANGRDEGLTKLLFDPENHRVIGGAVVGQHAGDLIGEICLAIEMGADATDVAQTILPHPTLGESIGMAAEVFEGTCTDLPPIKARRPIAPHQ